jgi:hypothetical protein
MSSASTLRVRLHRERLARGERIGRVRYNVVQVADALVTAGLLSPLCDDDEQIDRGIEKLLEVFAITFFTPEDNSP